MNLRCNWQLLSLSNSKLPFNKVEASNHFCNRVFNLKSSVHFHKVKFVVSCVKNKLNSTCIVIPDSLGSCDCSLTNLSSQSRCNLRRCFFNYFLMASLHSAVSFIQINIVTMFVAKNLYFNMPWLFYVLFENHVVILKSLHCLVFR
jgi:hypothetical protein